MHAVRGWSGFLVDDEDAAEGWARTGARLLAGVGLSALFGLASSSPNGTTVTMRLSPRT